MNLIPGPNSTEMAIYIGYLRAGWAGLVVAGVCFILPAMLMVTAIAWAYVRFGGLPQFAGAALRREARGDRRHPAGLWGLGRKAIKTPLLAAMAALAVAASCFGVDPLSLMLLAGVAVGWGKAAAARDAEAAQAGRGHARWWPAAFWPSVASPPAGRARPRRQVGLGPLFLYFLKVGSVLYGSGYVLLAFLQADLVDRWHWLTPAQLLDATAVGQVTPGPLFTTATFIGYLLGSAVGRAAMWPRWASSCRRSCSSPSAARWFRDCGNRRWPGLSWTA